MARGWRQPGGHYAHKHRLQRRLAAVRARQPVNSLMFGSSAVSGLDGTCLFCAFLLSALPEPARVLADGIRLCEATCLNGRMHACKRSCVMEAVDSNVVVVDSCTGARADTTVYDACRVEVKCWLNPLGDAVGSPRVLRSPAPAAAASNLTGARIIPRHSWQTMLCWFRQGHTKAKQLCWS